MSTYTISLGSNRPRWCGLILAWVLVLDFAAVRRADDTIASQVIASGGGTTTSATYTVRATLGEAVNGQAQSTNHAINAGFWFVASGQEDVDVTPTVSGWGLIVMLLLLLGCITLKCARRWGAATKAA